MNATNRIGACLARKRAVITSFESAARAIEQLAVALGELQTDALELNGAATSGRIENMIEETEDAQGWLTLAYEVITGIETSLHVLKDK